MKILIIDATGEKILLGLILNKNIYTGTYINSKKNYDKLTILINKFILKYKTKLEKIKKIYVNRGPGSYAGIRNSLSIVKAIHMSKKIDYYAYSYLDLKHKKKNHDLIKWLRLEIGLQKQAEDIWDPEIMEYPRILVNAIQEDAMVPIIDSDNAWIQLVSLQQELGHISVDDATVVLDGLQDKYWELGSSQQAMLYLLKSLYQDKQQSPKSRMLRKKAYDA